jgi:hypothetical protein
MILMTISTLAFAATINLYEKPDSASKIITTIKTGDRLIPIFYTEKKDWVKIANPKNGDVGWAQASELKCPVIITNINGNITQQQIVTDENHPKVYNVIQYSGTKELKPEDAQKMVKDTELQQQKIDESMQQMQQHMQQIFQDMSKVFEHNFYTFPVIQPIIVVPEISNDAL